MKPCTRRGWVGSKALCILNIGRGQFPFRPSSSFIHWTWNSAITKASLQEFPYPFNFADVGLTVSATMFEEFHLLWFSLFGWVGLFLEESAYDGQTNNAWSKIYLRQTRYEAFILASMRRMKRREVSARVRQAVRCSISGAAVSCHLLPLLLLICVVMRSLLLFFRC